MYVIKHCLFIKNCNQLKLKSCRFLVTSEVGCLSCIFKWMLSKGVTMNRRVLECVITGVAVIRETMQSIIKVIFKVLPNSLL